jgi:hypothetical protein
MRRCQREAHQLSLSAGTGVAAADLGAEGTPPLRIADQHRDRIIIERDAREAVLFVAGRIAAVVHPLRRGELSRLFGENTADRREADIHTRISQI